MGNTDEERSEKQVEHNRKRLEKRREKCDPRSSSNELTNPCIKESELSFQCLHDQDYDRDKCARYFQNYKNCQNFWLRVQKDRRREGVQPFLPAPEDRERIKAEYYQRATRRR